MNKICASAVPKHVAIIMDGNRRWARVRGLPSGLGHAAGAKRVRSIVQVCSDRGIRYLTLFAFSTENWCRPEDEVRGLMFLLNLYLQREISDMNARGVRLRVIGDVSRLEERTRLLIQSAQEVTEHNDRIHLTIAINYGGRWDMLQAVQGWQRDNPNLTLEHASEGMLGPYLSTSFAPDPDLLIRTGGDVRISNFMLWQLAYAELYFTQLLWPSFDVGELDKAIEVFSHRERRFGANGTHAFKVG